MVRGAGGPEGFGVDLVTEIARRLGRPGVEIVDVNFSGLFAALFAKRFEFTANPLNITEERAQRMLYTEPFFATGNGFVTRRADTLAKLEDLKGKAIAVNRGTISDAWATANAEKYGFEVQRYDTFPDSVQAVLTRRAFAAINEIPTTVYAASQNRQIQVAFKDYTGRNFGIAFRPESREYRNRVEEVIECMKLDGFLGRLHEKWYGAPADAGLLADPGLPRLRPARPARLRGDAAHAALQLSAAWTGSASITSTSTSSGLTGRRSRRGSG